MIELLLNKASDKKYHQSLKYFSHSLKGEKRIEFIKKLSSRDILLASQCVMSSEQCIKLESFLTDIALNQFNSDYIEFKIKGFLSLIELNRYEIIYTEFSKGINIDQEYRNAIKHVVGELDQENIIRLIDVILKTKTRGLINAVITSVESRKVDFTFEQKIKLESLFPLMINMFGYNNYRSLKYLKAFKLSKKLLPEKLDSIAKSRIKKGAYQLIIDIYTHFEIPFPFSDKDLCEIYLERNNLQNAMSFAQFFFNIQEKDVQYILISKALRSGKYFAAFIISLLKSSKDRHKTILSAPDFLILKKLTIPFTFIEYPNYDQKELLEIISNTYTELPEIEGKVVRCKVTGILPKTIFVDILPEKAKGTIWVKEFTSKYIEDIGKIVQIGDTLSAIVIGIGDKYVQLSVKQLEEKS